MKATSATDVTGLAAPRTRLRPDRTAHLRPRCAPPRSMGSVAAPALRLLRSTGGGQPRLPCAQRLLGAPLRANAKGCVATTIAFHAAAQTVTTVPLPLLRGRKPVTALRKEATGTQQRSPTRTLPPEGLHKSPVPRGGSKPSERAEGGGLVPVRLRALKPT